MNFKRVLLAAGMLSLGLSSAAVAEEAEQKHYNIGVTWMNNSFEAADGWAYVAFGISENVFQQNNDAELISSMIDDVEQVDEMTWKMTLKPEKKFADGTEMTAELFSAGLNESMANSGGTSTCGKLEFIPEEDGTVTVKTERPTTVLKSALCEMDFVVYKLDEEGKPVFTGPYMVDTMDPGVSMELIPNPYYDEKASGRPTLTVMQIGDNTSMVQAFESGELDFANALTPDAADQLKAEGLTVVDYDGGYQYFAILNLEREPFDDALVREAIALTMDRDEMVEALYGCLPATGFFGDNFSFNAQIDFTTDAEAAKDLLKEAGYEDTDNDGYVDKDGENLTMELATYTMHPELPTMMQVMASQLDAIGIEVTTYIVEGGMDKFASEGDFDIILYGGYTGNTSDPAAKLNAFFRTDGATNYNGYTNATIDEKLAELDTTVPGEERDALAKEIQELAAADNGVIYLIDSEFHAAACDELADYRPHGGDYYLITDTLGL